MKNFMTFLNVGIVLGLAFLFSGLGNNNAEENTPKETEAEIVSLKSTGDASLMMALKNKVVGNENTSIDKKHEAIVDFLQDASEARLMDMEEGKIAQQRATFRALKDYGTLMVKDQAAMLSDLKSIAAAKKIKISSDLGEKKADGLSDLKEVHGKEFDSKFIKMITIDHKRDLKMFDRALFSKDPDIQVFATKYLPMVKSHLNKIQSIKKLH